MDIDQTTRVVINEFFAKDAHETGEHHEVRPVSIDLPYQFSIK